MKKERIAEKIAITETSTSDKPLRRSFPGPRADNVSLRVTVNRAPYAELIAHAKQSLDAEVCGVLVGNICEDDDGLFVHVQAIITGTAAKQGSTHVTFTQATWNAIHTTLERDYPKLRIVGWYHTHPGFGVEFSDMDLFIQRNFFAGAGQIALVTDPLSGATAICVNGKEGIEYLPKFWVEGREQPCKSPEKKSAGASVATSTEDTNITPGNNALEMKLNQVLEAIDEQRRSFHRFLLAGGIVFCLAIITALGYSIFSTYASRNEPPKLNQFVPVPIQIGDKTVLLGVGVAEWQVPPELNAMLLQLEKEKQAAEEAAAREETRERSKKPVSTNKTTK